MGKAKRSKNKRNKSKGGNGGATSIPDGVNLPSSSEGSGILGRIRHGDPRVRFGALTALSATTFNADSFIAAAAASEASSNAAKTKKKQISDGLLKAISERIMDPDIPVAISAAGCVSNYASFSPDVEEGNGYNATTTNGPCTRNPAVLGGLGEVLLGRIAQCQKDIARYGQELAGLSQAAAAASVASSGGDIKAAGNASNKMEKTMRRLEEQWTLAHLCLEGLAGLVERSPMALERFGGAGHHANLVGATIGITSLAGQFLSSASKNAAAASAASVHAEIDEATTKAALDAASGATRCIHSALDENPALLQSVLKYNASYDSNAGTLPPLQVLLSAVDSGSMPALARLHSAGALVTARHLLPQTIVGDATTADVQSKLNEMDAMLSARVLPLLTQYLQYQPTIAAALIARISTAQSERDAELEDVKIEREVQKAVDDRKESARSIARRQKAEKDEKKAAERAAREGAAQGSATAMMEDSGADTNNVHGTPSSTTAGGGQNDESNVVESAEDLYEKAVETWRASCLALTLAVEVAANLCAGSGGGNNSFARDEINGGEGDEMMWDSDDEANLVAESSGTGADVNKEALARDEKLFEEVIRSSIPNLVVEIVRSVSTAHSADTSMPEVAKDDLVELLSKCGVCGSNAAGNMHAWAGKSDESARLWNNLCGIVRAPSPSHLASNDLVVAGKGAAVSVMLALLRNRPGLISSVGEEDLKAVLVLLSMQHEGENSIDARRDCIALLGILSSEPHPAAVNATICDAFLVILSREGEEVAIQGQILDAIMDMYSADETDEGNHEATFRQKNVLSALQAVLPNFKRRVALARGSADAESIELWKEVCINTKRFIAYKKGQ
jgi:hypothetical protein